MGRLSSFLLLMCFGVSTAGAQGRTAALTGVVVDTTGRPIRDAVVRVTTGGATALDSPAGPVQQTDSIGRFALSGIAPGPIIISVRRDGFRAITVEARVEAAVSVALRITLQLVEPGNTALPGSEVVADADTASPQIDDSLRTVRAAHTVSGIVLDSLGDVVPNVDVTLLGTELIARTDTAGGFVISEVGSGTYVIRARRLGFTPAFGKVVVTDSAAPPRLELWMKPLGQRLAKVTVRASGWSTAALNDFQRRRRLYTGVFLDQTELERVKGGRVSSLFYGRNGFTVVGSGANAGSVRGRSGCQAEVVVNRVLIRDATVDQLVSPSDVIAIEAYSSAINTPSELLGRGVREGVCGMIVVWTR